MQILDWTIAVDAAAPRPRWRGRRSAMPTASRARRSAIIEAVRRDGDAALRALHAALRRRRARPISRSPHAEFAAAERSLQRRPASRRSSARSRTCDRFHAAQAPAAVARRDRSRACAASAISVPIARRGAVRAGRLRAAALHRDHAGGAGAHRRLPDARAVHAAASAAAAPTPRCWWPRELLRHRAGLQGRRRAGDRRHGLRHRDDTQGATRSSAPATPG